MSRRKDREEERFEKIEKALRHLLERVERLERRTHPAISATLTFQNEKGDLMNTTVHLNDTPLKAVLSEFDGPDGTGNRVPSVGPTTYTSSDPTVATVDPSSGALNYVKEGQTTITGLNSGNGLTASSILTIISGLAQSATLDFVAQ